MSKHAEQLEALSEIRSMMERSSRFISLSGLSGVFAGVFALAGAAAAYMFFKSPVYLGDYSDYAALGSGRSTPEIIRFLFTDALLVLLASLSAGILFTVRKAKTKGQSIWDNTAKRLLINLMIPLISGGLFCVVLLYHGLIGLIAPSMLIFYGLGLINASKYTLNDIRYLGICEIALGLMASYFIGYGLFFWAIGFGVLHIVYGIVMYRKYE